MAQMLIDQLNSEWAAAPGTSDGTLVGRNTTTPVGFFGSVPVTQPVITIAGVTAAQILTALIALGLVKGV